MTLLPHEAADRRVTLSEEYSRLSDEMSELKKLSVKWFATNRPDHKSDKACERSFDATNEGLRMIELTFRLKAIEKEMSSLNTFIRNAENQAKNYY